MAARGTVFARWLEQAVQPLRVPGGALGEYVHNLSPVDLLLRLFYHVLDACGLCRRADTTAAGLSLGTHAPGVSPLHDGPAGLRCPLPARRRARGRRSGARNQAARARRDRGRHCIFLVSVLDRAVASSAIAPDDRVVFETIFRLVGSCQCTYEHRAFVDDGERGGRDNIESHNAPDMLDEKGRQVYSKPCWVECTTSSENVVPRRLGRVRLLVMPVVVVCRCRLPAWTFLRVELGASPTIKHMSSSRSSARLRWRHDGVAEG